MMRAFLNSVTSLKTASLTARMLAPVWAESFVNLVILTLGKPELKTDPRVYEAALRQQIDIRVTSLHLNCSASEASGPQAVQSSRSFRR